MRPKTLLTYRFTLGKSLPFSGLEISHLAKESVGSSHWFLISFPITPTQLKNE